MDAAVLRIFYRNRKGKILCGYRLKEWKESRKSFHRFILRSLSGYVCVCVWAYVYACVYVIGLHDLRCKVLVTLFLFQLLISLLFFFLSFFPKNTESFFSIINETWSYDICISIISINDIFFCLFVSFLFFFLAFLFVFCVCFFLYFFSIRNEG